MKKRLKCTNTPGLLVEARILLKRNGIKLVGGESLYAPCVIILERHGFKRNHGESDKAYVRRAMYEHLRLTGRLRTR